MLVFKQRSRLVDLRNDRELVRVKPNVSKELLVGFRIIVAFLFLEIETKAPIVLHYRSVCLVTRQCRDFEVRAVSNETRMD